jgi:hypothetical protein
MQCKDEVSGKTGDFIHAGDRKAISPVFDHWDELCRWMNANGWKSAEHVGDKYVPFRVVRA